MFLADSSLCTIVPAKESLLRVSISKKTPILLTEMPDWTRHRSNVTLRVTPPFGLTRVPEFSRRREPPRFPEFPRTWRALTLLAPHVLEFLDTREPLPDRDLRAAGAQSTSPRESWIKRRRRRWQGAYHG